MDCTTRLVLSKLVLILILSAAHHFVLTLQWPIWYSLNLLLCLALQWECKRHVPGWMRAGFVYLMVAIAMTKSLDLTDAHAQQLFFASFILPYMVWRLFFLIAVGAEDVGLLSILLAVLLTPFVKDSSIAHSFNRANALGILAASLAWYVLVKGKNVVSGPTG